MENYISLKASTFHFSKLVKKLLKKKQVIYISLLWSTYAYIFAPENKMRET